MANDITKRQRLWQEFLTHLKGATATQFDQMLRLNKYTGELLFDEAKETLNLDVHKGDKRDERKNDVKGLSGGERSYTTICLLIALGENLETPFRILDEFDVFLDPQNRKLVMSVLIHTAKQLLHRQFIFITYVLSLLFTLKESSTPCHRSLMHLPLLSPTVHRICPASRSTTKFASSSSTRR